MADRPPLEMTENNHIGKSLDAFRALFISMCEGQGIPHTSDALGQLGKEDIQDLAFSIIHALLKLPSTRLLNSKSHHGTIRADLLQLNSNISSEHYDLDRIKPVLNAVLSGKPDGEIWDQVYSAGLEAASPREISHSFQQSSVFHAGSLPDPEYPQIDTIPQDGITQVYESKLNISKFFRGNETVGAGISSWVLRLDAVAKCYTAADGKEREREIAVYERLGSNSDSRKIPILRYYGVFNECVILQLARHGSIRRYLRFSTHKPALSTQLRWAEQATDAISFLHSKGVKHCDIFCNNIFLNDNLDAMVGDFAGSSIDGKQCLAWYETSYCHPDVEDPSESSDIFALGSTFYEILVGKKPYEGWDVIEIQQAFRNGNFPSLESLPALDTVILNCWSGRYKTTTELLEDVRTEARAKPNPSLPNERQAFRTSQLACLAIAIIIPITWWVRSSNVPSRR